MGVFSKFNPNPVGRDGVLLQAHPAAEPVPWQPLKTTTRKDTQWGGAGRVHRVQPNERGKHFSSTPLGSWQNGGVLPAGASIGAAPAMTSGCGCGCAGSGGHQGMPLGGTVNKRP